MKLPESRRPLFLMLLLVASMAAGALSIRFPDRPSELPKDRSAYPSRTAVFALGSFWRSEAAFGCLDGVVRTAAVYAGGSKLNPEFRSPGDHAESVQRVGYLMDNLDHHSLGCLDIFARMGYSGGMSNLGIPEKLVALSLINYLGLIMGLPERILLSFKDVKYVAHIEYDPRVISFRQLLEVFWSSHDPTQVYGQGPDVGNQYRSIIFTNGTEEFRLAAISKEREQTKSRHNIVTTQVQQLRTFYPAEAEHQKFELKRNSFLLQLIGNLPQEELEKSSLAAKLNGYAAELCPPKIQKQISGKINDIIGKGWPILREV